LDSFIVGDKAFPLRTWLMKPVPKRNLTPEERIYNYRISRARRVVENAFGLLANRFRCLLTPMQQGPERVSQIATTCCILHNILRTTAPHLDQGMVDREDEDHDILLGNWRQGPQMHPFDAAVRGNRGTNEAKHQRAYLIEYVNSQEGSVPWQDDMAMWH